MLTFWNQIKALVAAMLLRNLAIASVRFRSMPILVAIGFSASMTIACTPKGSDTTQITQPLNISSAVNTNSTQSTEKNVIRMGYQKYGTLNLLKARGNLEQRFKAEGITVQWVQFPAGPQLLEALNAGSIDFGHTGEAPPIFAQVAGAPLVYVAHEPPNPRGEAILVRQDSPIQKVADLKGKKVALNKGSNVHYLLVQALTTAGLKYSDIQPVYLPPADARAAFERGSVDAWAIWDPFLTVAKRALNARLLEDGEGIVANREFYLAAKPFLSQHPERVKAILQETQAAGEWAKANPPEVAKLLSPQLGIDVPTLQEITQRRPYGVQPLQPDVVTYQQQVADTFYKLGLLPKQINVKSATSYQ